MVNSLKLTAKGSTIVGYLQVGAWIKALELLTFLPSKSFKVDEVSRVEKQDGNSEKIVLHYLKNT